MKLDPETEICICNSVTAKELAECIKQYHLETLNDVLEKSECNVGDKCEACHDEGFNCDGINIPLILSLVKQGKL